MYDSSLEGVLLDSENDIFGDLRIPSSLNAYKRVIGTDVLWFSRVYIGIIPLRIVGCYHMRNMKISSRDPKGDVFTRGPILLFGCGKTGPINLTKEERDLIHASTVLTTWDDGLKHYTGYIIKGLSGVPNVEIISD